MKTKANANSGLEAWENRDLGADEAHVAVAPERGAALDAALDLHPVSIRLQKSLVENLKALAHLHGLGYQPLIRQILTRWVDSELRMMVAKRASEAGFNPEADCGDDSQPPQEARRAA